LQRVMLTFQFAYIGAPFIYYGDEIGMWGADDPDCRKPMVWDDLKYDDEVTDPHDRSYGPYKIAVDQNMQNFYRSLIQLRRSEPALNHGDYSTIRTSEDNTFAFKRTLGNETVLAVFNYGESEWLPEAEVFGDNPVDQWKLKLDSKDSDQNVLKPLSARIYKLATK